VFLSPPPSPGGAQVAGGGCPHYLPSLSVKIGIDVAGFAARDYGPEEYVLDLIAYYDLEGGDLYPDGKRDRVYMTVEYIEVRNGRGQYVQINPAIFPAAKKRLESDQEILRLAIKEVNRDM